MATKKCTSCGKDFTPAKPHYSLCSNCVKQGKGKSEGNNKGKEGNKSKSCPYCLLHAGRKDKPNPLPDGRSACYECIPIRQIFGVVSLQAGKHVVDVWTMEDGQPKDLPFTMIVGGEGFMPPADSKIKKGKYRLELIPSQAGQEIKLIVPGAIPAMYEIPVPVKEKEKPKSGKIFTSLVKQGSTYRLVIQTTVDGVAVQTKLNVTVGAAPEVKDTDTYGILETAITETDNDQKVVILPVNFQAEPVEVTIPAKAKVAKEKITAGRITAELHKGENRWNIVVQTYINGEQKSAPYIYDLEDQEDEERQTGPDGKEIIYQPYSNRRLAASFNLIGFEADPDELIIPAFKRGFREVKGAPDKSLWKNFKAAVKGEW